MGCSNSKPAAVVSPSASPGNGGAANTANPTTTTTVPKSSLRSSNHPRGGGGGGNLNNSRHGVTFSAAPTDLPPRDPLPAPVALSNGSLHGKKSLGSHSMHERSLSADDSAPKMKHSVSAVGLDQYLETRKEDGTLGSNIVNIEVPFGKPIEEVYSGVHDGPVLGSGISGVVRLCTHIATNVKYAVKCLDLGLLHSAAQLTSLRNEIFIMCQLDHPNIVRLEEVYESHSEIYLVLELCLGGELFDRLDEQPDYHYSESECARLVKQMLCSVRYIHSKGIIHRDLKLENFLFSSQDADSELKMIDFGLSKHFIHGELENEAVGTPYTVAPEVLRGRYDERCDIWAIGVIAFLLLSGDPPFGGCGGPEPLSQVRANILSGTFQFEPSYIWNHVSTTAKDFIETMLVTDPSSRPRAEDAQKHPWIVEWANKNKTIDSSNLDPEVVKSLVNFKEYSDMRKLLYEVLSFTLLPDQISNLRKEFEKMDTDGSGEISLEALKTVLMENAEVGALGGLTEEEVQDIFDAMRVRKDETTIHWHEFLAAGLSQCEVDDRNLKLAFNRLDREHKGYITLENFLDLMGGDATEEDIRSMYQESLLSIQGHGKHGQLASQYLSYEDFLLLMKGQTREIPRSPMFQNLRYIGGGTGLAMEPPELALDPLQEENEEMLDENSTMGSHVSPPASPPFPRKGSPITKSVSPPGSPRPAPLGVPAFPRDRLRSKSYDEGDNYKTCEDDLSLEASPKTPHHSQCMPHSGKPNSALAMPERKGLPEHIATVMGYHIPNLGGDKEKHTNLTVNRELYRAHRQLRLAVLEASKRFEEETARRMLQELRAKEAEKYPEKPVIKAGLIMRRGTQPHARELSSESIRNLLSQREEVQRKIVGQASRKSGRSRRQKVVSDMSGMLASSNSDPSPSSPEKENRHSVSSVGRRDNNVGMFSPIKESGNGNNASQSGEESGPLSNSSSEGNLQNLFSGIGAEESKTVVHASPSLLDHGANKDDGRPPLKSSPSWPPRGEKEGVA